RGEPRLPFGRLAHDRLGPGAVVDPRERLLIVRDAFEVDRVHGLAGEPSRSQGLRTQGDVAHGPVEERTEPPGPIVPSPIEQAAGPEAFNEHLLDGVIKLPD